MTILPMMGSILRRPPCRFDNDGMFEFVIRLAFFWLYHHLLTLIFIVFLSKFDRQLEWALLAGI
jgi:hypothetical protein